MDDNSKYIGAYADLLTQVAENVEAVYAAGVKSEYDRFWDNYQQNGVRANYDQAFSYNWNDELFNPKYDLIAKSCSMMFQYTSITDLKDKLENKGLKLDTSQATSLLQMFQGANIIHIPEIDAQKATNMSYAFGSNCKAVTIDKLIVSENTVLGTTTFNQAGKLENIVIEGTIASPIDLHWSTKLTHESLMSFINALKDFSGTTTTKTCTLGATNLAKLTDTEKAIATEKGWTLA